MPRLTAAAIPSGSANAIATSIEANASSSVAGMRSRIVVVTGWLDATSLAYGAYVDGSLPGLVIVSDNELRMPVYRQWARRNRVFVLAVPHELTHLAGARYYMRLDNYHELFVVTP